MWATDIEDLSENDNLRYYYKQVLFLDLSIEILRLSRFEVSSWGFKPHHSFDYYYLVEMMSSDGNLNDSGEFAIGSS